MQRWKACKPSALYFIFFIYFFCLAFLLQLCPQQAHAAALAANLPPSFTLHSLGNGEGPTLLVIGGIQGDEPGGFSAASLLVTHYQINKGSIWVVPNLNFPSIISSTRGLHGDMNRKFASISSQDPEFETVRRVQELILDPKVDLVLNLHDGSGFYRHVHENRLRNPSRWGQCIVIDQEAIDPDLAQNPRFQNLHGIASRVADEVNTRLLQHPHLYNIKNTHTRNYDREMEKSLSYFAICAGKAAFGLEASKELPPGIRAYYHACLLEAFMREMGIEFTRKFQFSPQGVLTALNRDVSVRLYDNRTVLALDDARSVTSGYIPVRRGADVKIAVSNPLLAVLPGKKQWRVVYGNRTLTSFTPQYFDFDESLNTVELVVDGERISAKLGDMIQVRKSFVVESLSGYRVNAIGATEEVDGSECGVTLRREHFQNRFSLDRAGQVYRVEIYKDHAFCGMVLINFGRENSPMLSNNPLTARAESSSDSDGR
jgi:hypothetical protein